MTKTYSQLQKQIAELQSQAQKLRTAEVGTVVARIKDAVKAYGLTVQDLFGPTKGKKAKAAKATKATKAKPDRAPKYADGSGNEWVGRGPRPVWLREALASGKALGDFLVGANASKAEPKKAKVAVTKKAVAKKAPAKGPASKKKARKAKYRDEAGNSWTGMGPTPRWLKEAIADGTKKLEDFRV
jgi:DNA-binding protein H-NS